VAKIEKCVFWVAKIVTTGRNTLNDALCQQYKYPKTYFLLIVFSLVFCFSEQFCSLDYLYMGARIYKVLMIHTNMTHEMCFN
jgi:zona occludens toxin (predicted ATPase)